MSSSQVDYLQRLVRTSELLLFNANNNVKELLQKQKKLQDAIKILKTDNDNLKKRCHFEREKYMCNICYQNQKNCIITPCNHFASCLGCAKQVNNCPVCRQNIKSYIKLFVI